MKHFNVKSVNPSRHTAAESGGGVQFGTHSAQAEAAAVADVEAGAAGEHAAEGGDGVKEGAEDAAEEKPAVHPAGELGGRVAGRRESFQASAALDTAVAEDELGGQAHPSLLSRQEVGREVRIGTAAQGGGEGFLAFAIREHRRKSVKCAYSSERGRGRQGKMATFIVIFSTIVISGGGAGRFGGARSMCYDEK